MQYFKEVLLGNKVRTMPECIFCKIAKGEIPSFKVGESEKALAFLDVNPGVKGHTLVIPKNHAESIFDVSENDLKEVSALIKKVAERMEKNLKADGVNVLNASGKAAQQSVFHLHFHVIPRFENDGLNTWPFKEKLAGLDLKELAEKLRE